MDPAEAQVLLFIDSSYSDGSQRPATDGRWAVSEPVSPTLFASLDPLTLAGSRCAACTTVQFPPARQCAHCAGDDLAVIELPRSGRIWTWTVQRFAPKAPYVPPPTGFVPYGVGYVDLGEVLVETLLLMADREPSIGDAVHLVRSPAPDDRFTYAFAPCAPGERPVSAP